MSAGFSEMQQVVGNEWLGGRDSNSEPSLFLNVVRRQADHLTVEYAALTCGLEQRRARFRMIDEELMGPSRHIRLHSRCAVDDDDASV